MDLFENLQTMKESVSNQLINNIENLCINDIYITIQEETENNLLILAFVDDDKPKDEQNCLGQWNIDLNKINDKTYLSNIAKQIDIKYDRFEEFTNDSDYNMNINYKYAITIDMQFNDDYFDFIDDCKTKYHVNVKVKPSRNYYEVTFSSNNFEKLLKAITSEFNVDDYLLGFMSEQLINQWKNKFISNSNSLEQFNNLLKTYLGYTYDELLNEIY